MQRSSIAGLVLMLALSNACGDDLQQADLALNSAYKDVIHSYAAVGNTAMVDQLKRTELDWIIYRDAQGNLEGWIAGKSRLDKAGYNASLLKTTLARTAELKAMLQPSVEDPNSMTITQSTKTSGLYATLHDYVLYTKNSHLIAALINDEKAWNNYIEESITSTETGFTTLTARREQLKIWGKELDIDLSNAPTEGADD